MAEERGSSRRAQGSGRRSFSGGHQGNKSKNYSHKSGGFKGKKNGGGFHHKTRDGERRDFHRDGEKREFRRDGDRRDFHRDGEHRNNNPRYNRDRNNDQRTERRHDNQNRHRSSEGRERRQFTREEQQAYRDKKRQEAVSKSRRNSDGTVSFPSQNPYTAARPDEPTMPKGLTWNMLSKDDRERLRGLAKEHAENIGLHILAAYVLEADDPKLALEHAKWVAKQASRIDFARETLAFVAYRQGDYKLALREFRTAFRMNGYLDYLPFMADCERGLGQPKKAIEIALSDDAKWLNGEPKAEMFLVYAGALADLGQYNKAIEIVSKLSHARGLAGEYRMRAAQAEQFFLEQAGRSDDAVALEEFIDALELKYADVEEDVTDDNFVVDYDVEDLPEDLMAQLGVTPDDAQYAPFDNEDGVNMDDETRLAEEEERSGAELEEEPALMQERNEEADADGTMADPDLSDVDENEAQIGDFREQIEAETE